MFNNLKKVIKAQLHFMSGYRLLTADVNKDELWEVYLKSFPEGSNPVYRERTEHDCQCCKQFIRKAGAVVAIINGELVSIWDVEIEGAYGVVARAMSDFVKGHVIENEFVHYESNVGTNKNHQQTDTGVITWNHFHYKLPAKFVMPKDQIDTYLGKVRTEVEMLTRALNEITDDAIETVLDLIGQNSLYKGVEYKANVTKLKQIKRDYGAAVDRRRFLWSVDVPSAVARIRNSAIGTMLADLSGGMDLNEAVTRYESITAPENYKRPTALITKGMITKAQGKVAELGLSEALNRRFAVASDLTVVDTLFANREARKAMNVFEELSNTVPDKKPNLDKVENISIDDFMKNVVPTADSIAVMVENRHCNNLVSLIAPMNIDAPDIFKWDNNFSWSYNGEVTDSMKERVRKAGGNVEGVLRLSLQWNEDGKSDPNTDLDLHCIEPGGNLIYYPSAGKMHPSTGVLDVDNTSPGNKIAVENTTWSNLGKMRNGAYEFIVHNYSETKSSKGFTAEIEFDGTVYAFEYDKALRGKEKVLVATISFNRDTGIKLSKALPSVTSSKEIWGIQTHRYQNVSMITYSPNFWDSAGQGKGNKHWFFMLTGCLNPDPARGFYNEFLRDDLTEHRKVFEVLSSKLKAPTTTEQLSGIGFSSTKRNSVLVKVSGVFSRVVKVNF